MTKLTPKQERFCQEIVKGKSQSDAYRAAFKPKRSTAKSIHEEASRMMANIKVASRIKDLLAPVVAKVQMTREEWLLEMEKCARGDVRKLFVGPGQPVEIHELGDNEAAIIEGYKVTENFAKVGDKAEHVGYTHEVKFGPRQKRLLEFGKVMGWYTEKKELSLDATLEELVLGSMKMEEGKK